MPLAVNNGTTHRQRSAWLSCSMRVRNTNASTWLRWVSGTIFGFAVVPEVCSRSPMSSGRGRSATTAARAISSADKLKIPAGSSRANASRTMGTPRAHAACAAGGCAPSAMMSAAARILARRKRHDASSLAGLSGAQLDQLIADKIATAISAPLGRASAIRCPRPSPIAANDAPTCSTWRRSASYPSGGRSGARSATDDPRARAWASISSSSVDAPGGSGITRITLSLPGWYQNITGGPPLHPQRDVAYGRGSSDDGVAFWFSLSQIIERRTRS